MQIEGYPGVYTQKIPSGVRTIVAASTSTLAVVGHFPRGPVDQPVYVTSWSDVVRTFGERDDRYVGLDVLGDFYEQGGSVAWVTRVYIPKPAQSGSSEIAVEPSSVLRIFAVEPAIELRASHPTAGPTLPDVEVEQSDDGGSITVTLRGGELSDEPQMTFSTDPDNDQYIGGFGDFQPFPGAPPSFEFAARATPMTGTFSGGDSWTSGDGQSVLAVRASEPARPAIEIRLNGVLAAGSDGTPALRVEGIRRTRESLLFSLVVESDSSAFELDLGELLLDPFGQLTAQSVEEGLRDQLEAYLAELATQSWWPPAGVESVELLRGSLLPGAAENLRPEVAESDLWSIESSEDSGSPAGGTEPSDGIASVIIGPEGGDASFTVRAKSPGEWGNSLRVGFFVSGQKFDMRIEELRGSRIVASEVFRDLGVDSTDPRSFASGIVNEQSRLVDLVDVEGLPPLLDPQPESVEDLGGDQLRSLSGGQSGALPSDEGSLWSDNCESAFKGVVDESQEPSATGLQALTQIQPERFNLLSVPEAAQMPDSSLRSVYASAGKLCAEALAFLLVDHPKRADSIDKIHAFAQNELGLGLEYNRSASLCFPRLKKRQRNSPLQVDLQSSGAIAGVMARTDRQFGVWKAPAGYNAAIAGRTPSLRMTDRQQARLNKSGISCTRVMPGVGTVVWGARTLAGADRLSDEWKYIPVRRTALMLEQTFANSLGWAVFQPNSYALWAQLRMNIGAFMRSLYQKGAFAGNSPTTSYFVKCDEETTSQQDINSGIVNIIVGFAPLKPAEFVCLKLTQMAGRLES